jgi:hypothetical protein
MYIQGTVSGRQVTILIDTGAEVSLVKRGVVETTHMKEHWDKGVELYVRGIGGVLTKSLGITRGIMSINGSQTNLSKST